MHVIWPQCVNSLWPGDYTWRDSLGNIGVVNGIGLSGAKTLPELMLTYWHLGPYFSEIEIKVLIIGFMKSIWKCGLNIDRLLFRPKYAIVINSLSLERNSANFRRIILLDILTHCGLKTPYGNTDLGQHWLR